MLTEHQACIAYLALCNGDDSESFFKLLAPDVEFSSKHYYYQGREELTVALQRWYCSPRSQPEPSQIEARVGRHRNKDTNAICGCVYQINVKTNEIFSYTTIKLENGLVARLFLYVCAGRIPGYQREGDLIWSLL